jgi:hypothetical protein
VITLETAYSTKGRAELAKLRGMTPEEMQKELDALLDPATSDGLDILIELATILKEEQVARESRNTVGGVRPHFPE